VASSWVLVWGQQQEKQEQRCGLDSGRVVVGQEQHGSSVWGGSASATAGFAWVYGLGSVGVGNMLPNVRKQSVLYSKSYKVSPGTTSRHS
jgi:hypothetical protein